MTSTVRATVGKILRTTPVYRVLPPGSLRYAAGVLYHDHISAEAACRYVAEGRASRRPVLIADLTAARAAFRTGRDDLARGILMRVRHRFPDRSAACLLLAELASFQGEASSALDHAVMARILEPTLPTNAAAEIRIRYQADTEDADEVALAAVERFPAAPPVLWAAARGCVTEAQYDRLGELWRAAGDRPDRVLAGIRPLGLAAARVGAIDDAVALYAEGMVLIGRGLATTQVQQRRLRGTGAAGVVRELASALGAAGIPYFLAAGTALGYVREGEPLGHDADIDIGVPDTDWDRSSLLELFDRHPSFRPDVVHPTSDKISLRHRGGAPVDVFRFYREGDRVFHDGTFVRWWNTPFAIASVESVHGPVPVPDDHERYLTENYGDWRVPEPAFDAFIDAPNVEVTWPEYRALHLARRAFARLSAGEVVAARNDLATIASMLRRSPAGRELADRLALP